MLIFGSALACNQGKDDEIPEANKEPGTIIEPIPSKPEGGRLLFDFGYGPVLVTP